MLFEPKMRIQLLVWMVALVFGLSCSSVQKGRRQTASNNSLPDSISLIGYVPSRYIPERRGNASYVLSAVTIRDGIIESVTPITESQAADWSSDSGVPTLSLRSRSNGDYDVIYPGLIDLHNHTKQNNLGLWGEAKGQFENRFEWRDWPNYKKAVSSNINPWISFGEPVVCAAFRWSELQAMVLGTTYLQGPSSCITNFGIHRVEDANAFRTSGGVLPKLPVQAPTDIIFPREMAFVWNDVFKKMRELAGTEQSGKPPSELIEETLTRTSYEEGLKALIHQYCPDLRSSIQDVNGSAELAILKKPSELTANCSGYPDLFVRYVHKIHPTIAGKKNYLLGKSADSSPPEEDPMDEGEDETPVEDIDAQVVNGNEGVRAPSAVIAHLAEGRRKDPYNQLEFFLLRILGLDLPRFNLVHGVGIDAAGFALMAQKGMGLIWSPFSNLLLYGETADIKAAHEAGVLIALGSDWTPTGSRGVLEELKMARAYIKKKPELSAIFNDEYLYKMVTENAAQMIGHLESDPDDGFHDIGTIAPGAMGSLIAVTKTHSNPYTNLVLADERAVNLVIVDGRPLYGNISYINAFLRSAGAASDFEDTGVYYEELNSLTSRLEQIPTLPVVNAAYFIEYAISLAPGILSGEITDPKEAFSLVQSRLSEFDTASLMRSYREFLQNFAEPKSSEVDGEILRELTKLNDPSQGDEAFSSKLKMAHLVELMKMRQFQELQASERCSMPERKVLIHQNSGHPTIQQFEQQSGLNLDRFQDIQKLLAVNLMSQSRNLRDKKGGDPRFAPSYFPPLHSCSDPEYQSRFKNFIEGADENTVNVKTREQRRAQQRLGRGPRALIAPYGL